MKKTTSQFVEDAQKVHGDRFDYSEVEYVNTHKPVRIKCRQCGVIFTVHIPGAADKVTGTDDQNPALSIERAKYIGNQLMSRGVPKENLKATSLGGINQFTPKEANRFCVVLVK